MTIGSEPIPTVESGSVLRYETPFGQGPLLGILGAEIRS